MQKAPVYDSHGNLTGTPFVPQDEPGPAELTDKEAIAAVLAYPKVADWVERYPTDGLTKQATLDEDAGSWSVKIWSDLPDAGQIVDAKVDDQTAEVTEAWTGPQVAWKMARGYDGAFGRGINRLWVWLTFCVVFLVGLADFRRIASVRNLDLLVLLSFSASLYFFNIGDVFTAMPLVYPALAYLLGRMIWVGVRGRGGSSRPVWPVWALLAATVFLMGFRTTLNVVDSNVIDVGLAGIDGGQRIVQGEMPYGHMPTDDGKACGLPDSEGYVREHVQTNGRCESANERGDTYGPVSYLAYVPGYLAVGFGGKWNGGSSTWAGLPAAHLTSLLWDLLALVGMGVLGLRFGGRMLGATLAFAWAAYPFTQYVSSSNSNDAIMPALLVWGLVFLTSPPGPRALPRARRVDEVRRPPAPAALGLVSGLARRPPEQGHVLPRLRARHRDRVLDPLPRARSAPRGARLLGPDVRLAALALVPVLDLGLGPVPGVPEPPSRPDRAQDRSPLRRARGLLRASREERAPGRRPVGRASDRLRGWC